MTKLEIIQTLLQCGFYAAMIVNVVLNHSRKA